MNDVSIWDPEGGLIIAATHVQTGIRLDRLVWAQLRAALPGGRPDLELVLVDAIVDAVSCRIETLKDGRANLVAAFGRRRPEPDRGGGMVLTVERSTIRDGQFRMAFPKWSAEIDHFEMHDESLRYSSFAAEQAPGRPAFTYAVRRIVAPTGVVRAASYSFPLDHFVATDFHAAEPSRGDMVFRGSSRSLGAEIAFDGKLTDLYGQDRGVDLAVDARHGGKILALFPSRRWIGGNPSATAQLKGRFSDVVIEGQGRGFELHFDGIEAREASARYRLGGGRLRLRECDAEVLHGRVRGEVTLELLARRWSADLTTMGIQPLAVKRFIPLTLLAYVAASLPRLALDAKGSGVATVTLHIGHVELTLQQKPHEALPSHLLLHGPL